MFQNVDGNDSDAVDIIMYYIHQKVIQPIYWGYYLLLIVIFLLYFVLYIHGYLGIDAIFNYVQYTVEYYETMSIMSLRAAVFYTFSPTQCSVSYLKKRRSYFHQRLHPDVCSRWGSCLVFGVRRSRYLSFKCLFFFFFCLAVEANDPILTKWLITTQLMEWKSNYFIIIINHPLLLPMRTCASLLVQSDICLEDISLCVSCDGLYLQHFSTKLGTRCLQAKS